MRLRRSHRVAAEQAGRRVDQVAAEVWPDLSRSRLAGWIREGALTVNGRQVKPKARVDAGNELELDAAIEPHPDTPEAEAIPLDVRYQDAWLLVINKPAGLVVHPGSGNTTGTLVNALLHWDPGLAVLPRAGLVHRLDKDTSGCLLVARRIEAHAQLVRSLKRREIHRRYQAVIWGHPVTGGRIEAAIGRHPVDRRRQVVREDGRRAVTHYRIRERLAACSLIDVELETGRTHQIRVHMAHVGHPLVGDPVYGRRGCPAGLTPAQRDCFMHFPRQALHACALELDHPADGSRLQVEAPIPRDMSNLIRCLRDEPSLD